MATNLVALVTQFLTPEVIAKIASALGLDRTISQKAITAAIPAILACLGYAVSKPGGERQLTNALSQQPANALDSLMNIIGGSGQKALAEQKSLAERGSSLLSGLLGGNTQDALTRAIGRYAGIGEGASKSMVGMLGPVVLGALGQQQRSEGLDTRDLANLLTSQSRQIAAALPSGLAEHMSAAGLADVLGGSVRGAAAMPADAPSATVARAASVPSTAAAQWPYWVLGVVVLAGLAWLLTHYWGGDRQVAERQTQTRPIAAQPTPTEPRVTVGVAPASVTVGGENLAYQVSSSIGSLQTMLTGITDSASAQSALPKLREITAQFDKVSAQSSQLPQDGRKSLAALITTAMPNINSALDRILAIPGVGDIVRPVVNELRSKIDAIARA